MAGGSDTNSSITGTPTNINGNFIVNDVNSGTADDTIHQPDGIKARGKVEIIAPEAGMKTPLQLQRNKTEAGIEISIPAWAQVQPFALSSQPLAMSTVTAEGGVKMLQRTLGKFAASDSKQER